MKNQKPSSAPSFANGENLVLDTEGGRMPDVNRKAGEKASDAAKAFNPSGDSKAGMKSGSSESASDWKSDDQSSTQDAAKKKY